MANPDFPKRRGGGVRTQKEGCQPIIRPEKNSKIIKKLRDGVWVAIPPKSVNDNNFFSCRTIS